MSGILDSYGRPLKVNGNGKPKRFSVPAASRRAIQARYDLQTANDQNTAHWSSRDALDADAANSLSVRKKYRECARYEIANNSYLKGMVLTLANHVVGTGPTLQVQTTSTGFNAMIEARFTAWAEAVDLAGKLRTLEMAQVGDGEGFGILVNNPLLPDRVQIDLRLIECDQVTSPAWAPSRLVNYIDGVHTDSIGNPVAYDILQQHPGAEQYIARQDATKLPASDVVHLFRQDRPGQHRGIPHIAPALPLFAGLRRFTAATIKAAETAADIALALETDLVAGGEPDEIDPGAVDVPLGTMFQLPYGWKGHQIDAKHPNTQFEVFRRCTINEAARCLDMPPNIAMCDSADYNFASGRLDHQTYFASIGVRQAHSGRHVLSKVFAAWFREACLVYAWDVPAEPAPPHQWYWIGQPYSDPEAEANAIAVNLASGMTGYPAEYARRGLDWMAEQTKNAEALGIGLVEYQELLRLKLFGNGNISPQGAGNGQTQA